jgi:hypothetical protein
MALKPKTDSLADKALANMQKFGSAQELKGYLAHVSAPDPLAYKAFVGRLATRLQQVYYNIIYDYEQKLGLFSPDLEAVLLAKLESDHFFKSTTSFLRAFDEFEGQLHSREEALGQSFKKGPGDRLTLQKGDMEVRFLPQCD